MNLNEILAVYDPTQDSQPAVERGIMAATVIKANLTIFACIYSETPKSIDEIFYVKQQASEQKEKLEAIAAPLRQQGLNVKTEVEWDKNWAKSIVRASLRTECDIVLKSTHKQSAGKRLVNRTSDRILIRECFCPLLFVRESALLDSRKVLAAIDIRAETENYLKLNQKIIDITKVLGQRDAELHFVNAYSDAMAFPDRKKLIEFCGVETQYIHIDMGSPEDVILDRAKDLGASMVVIGSSRRSGLAALIEGNTIEKVLDNLHCDLLSIP